MPRFRHPPVATSCTERRAGATANAVAASVPSPFGQIRQVSTRHLLLKAISTGRSLAKIGRVAIAAYAWKVFLRQIVYRVDQHLLAGRRTRRPAAAAVTWLISHRTAGSHCASCGRVACVTAPPIARTHAPNSPPRGIVGATVSLVSPPHAALVPSPPALSVDTDQLVR